MATTSSKKTMSPFLINLRQGVFSNWKLMILILCMDILFIPMIFLNAMNANSLNYQLINNLVEQSLATQNKLDTYDLMMTLGGFSGLIVLLLVGVCAFQSFSYLLNKSESDMYFALPLSRNQRFLSDYCSGALSWLLPSIVSLGVAFVIYQSNLANIHCDFSELWSMALVVQVVKFDIYTMLVFALQVSGRKWSGILNAALLILVIPLFFVGCCELVAALRDCYGIAEYPPVMTCFAGASWLVPRFESMWETIRDLSGFYGRMTITSYYDGYDTSMDHANWLTLALYMLLHSAVLFVLSWISHRKRKAETVFKTFPLLVWKCIVQFLITIGAIVMVFIAGDSFESISNVITVGFVVSVIGLLGFEFISEPNSKHLLPRLCIVMGTAAASTALLVVAMQTSMFGLGKIPPSTKDLKSMKVTMEGEVFTLTSSEQWNRVQELYRNSRVPLNFFSKPEPDEMYIFCEVEYYYNEGVARTASNYNLNDINAWIDGFLPELYYADAIQKAENCLADKVKFRYSPADQLVMADYAWNYVNLTEEQQKQFIEAYSKELMSVKPSEYLSLPRQWNIHAITPGPDGTPSVVSIPCSFTNTLNVLKEWGVLIPEVDESMNMNNEFKYLTADQLVKDGYGESYCYDYYTYSELEESSSTPLFHSLTKEEYAELMPYCYKQNHCFGMNEPRSLVFVDHTSYYLLEDGEKLLAEIAAK